MNYKVGDWVIVKSNGFGQNTVPVGTLTTVTEFDTYSNWYKLNISLNLSWLPSQLSPATNLHKILYT